MTSPCCTGYGAGDTRKEVFSNGRPNPMGGQPYGTVTAKAIFEQVLDPPTVPKEQAQWMVPSSYHDFDAREHTAQRQSGWYQWLVADIDYGSPDLAKVTSAVRTALGPAPFLVYSTRSATPDNRKWRVLVPLIEPIPGEWFPAFQAAFFTRLHLQGLVLDSAPMRTGQVAYLPNRGAFYEFHVEQGSGLALSGHGLSAEAAVLYSQEAEARLAAEARRAERANKGFGVVDRFNEVTDLDEMLHWCGYQPRGDGINWSSPYQQKGSGGYSTRNYGDHLVTLSGSDADADLGLATGNGGRYINAFDLFQRFVHNGSFDNALEAARLSTVYGAATSAHGREIWEHAQRIKAERAKARTDALQTSLNLPATEGDNSDWTLGWPPGLVGDLAQYIYASSSRPIKQFSIAAALFLTTAVSRKYNIEGTGLNLYMMLVAETGRGKGVVSAIKDRLVQKIVTQTNNREIQAVFGQDVPASSAGLRKALMDALPNPVLGVYKEDAGATLDDLVNSQPGGNGDKLRAALTALWDGSGEGRVIGGVRQSKREESTDLIESPSLSLGLDTQPGSFNRFLGSGHIDTGFLPRMLLFYYYGERAYHNKDSRNHKEPPEGLLQRLIDMINYAMNSHQVVQVGWTPDALAMFDDLDREYTDKINAGGAGAELVNRAHMNVAKVAGLVAVGVNHLNPVVDVECFSWAKGLVDHGHREAVRIMSSGEAGSGEGIRVALVSKAVKAFMKMPIGRRVGSYRVPKGVGEMEGVIPESFFLEYLKNSKDFAGSDVGASREDLIRKAVGELVKQERLEMFSGIRPPRTVQPLYVIGEHF